MRGLRLFYIVCLVILGGGLILLLCFTTRGEQFTEVRRDQLIQQEEEWILQFDIINHEETDTNYTVNLLVGEKEYSSDVTVKKGRTFTYIHHIQPETARGGEILLTVYREGESTPVKQTTYFVK